jgi:hypothetical protein
VLSATQLIKTATDQTAVPLTPARRAGEEESACGENPIRAFSGFLHSGAGATTAVSRAHREKRAFTVPRSFRDLCVRRAAQVPEDLAREQVAPFDSAPSAAAPSHATASSEAASPAGAAATTVSPVVSGPLRTFAARG